ncbi:MAG: DUF5615 family PIN-like protein [Verrucomicrobia bacterium]|nr:DUF5615 family PIN-like protein [Verrucomicrobiota bacterium]
MRFIVDAHLSPGICKMLQAAGHDAIHTTQLSNGNRTSDQTINELSLSEQRVLISKDTDFYYSLLLHHKPGNWYWYEPATSAIES